jgi:hypothetical protein
MLNLDPILAGNYLTISCFISFLFPALLILFEQIRMGTKIPRGIRLEVIRNWLQGKTRDQIAEEVHIGAGTVSGIIKEYRSGDFDADLLREVALNLKNTGLDIRSFAPLVRLRVILEEKEWILGVRPGLNKEGKDELDGAVENNMESLIMSIEVFCYKEGLSAREFFDCVHSMYVTAEKLDIPLESFPNYIDEVNAQIENLLEQIKYIESEKQIALEKSHTTEKILEEFSISRSKFDENQQLKQKLEQVTKERDEYKITLDHERIWNRKTQENMWSILVSELDKANKDLGSNQALTPKNLKEMVMDVYYYPSKNVDIIRELSERHNGNTKRKAE